MEDNNKKEKKNGFINKMVEEIVEEEASQIENLILMPLYTCGLFTICYLDNPIMNTIWKYLLVASSIVFTIHVLELVEMEFWVLCLVGLGSGLLCLILETLKISQNLMAIFYELISVFAAIGYISIFSGLIIDFITFLAFYFSIDEVILNSILLSAGNTIGDFFGNAALAKAGEGVMGAFATYSGQIFNNFIGFAVSTFSATQIKETGFDIFGIYKQRNLRHYFLMCVVGTVCLLLIFTFVYLNMTKFVLTRKLCIIFVCIYTVFFVSSMIFGFLSRG